MKDLGVIAAIVVLGGILPALILMWPWYRRGPDDGADGHPDDHS